MKKVLLLSCVLLFAGECYSQTFSKDFLTLRVGEEYVVIRASLDKTTKQHFARDFMLSNFVSFFGVKESPTRLFMYTFIIAFELGQRELDLIDILAGVIAVELNFCLRR